MSISSSRLRNGEGPPVTVGEFIAALSRFPIDSVVKFSRDSPSVMTPDGERYYHIAAPLQVDQINLVLQEGGSTGEWYASSHPTTEAAENAIRSMKAASYNAIGPIRPGESLEKFLSIHGDNSAVEEFYTIIEDVAMAVATRNFSTLEPKED